MKRLTAPTSRLYIRVNTLKINVEEFKDLALEKGIRLMNDEEIMEALWAKVEGPLKFNIYTKKVIADKRAAETVMMGSDLFLPGVLKAKGVAPGDNVTILAPNGIPVASGIAVRGARDLRSNIGEKMKRGVFVKVTEPMYRSVKIGDLPGRDIGLFYGQGLPSMYVAHLLNPNKNDRIIDLTAAPGGKVSHVAQLLGPNSKIVAVDRKSKLPKLEATLRRLGITWVKTIGHDSRYLPLDYPSLNNSFDKAIVDPPCSNLGVIPKVEDRKTIKDSINLANYQLQLVKSAWKLLRKGGVLIYSVCTLSYLEAEAQASRIESLGFEFLEPDSWAKRPLRSLRGLWFSPLIHGVTGFYIALFRKIDS